MAPNKLPPYVGPLRDVSIVVIPIFGDNKVPFVCDSFAILPRSETPPKFGEHGVITVPRFKVDGTPRSDFLSPNGTHSFKRVASGSQSGIYAFEALVILLDILDRGLSSPDLCKKQDITFTAFLRDGPSLKILGETILISAVVRRHSDQGKGMISFVSCIACNQ